MSLLDVVLDLLFPPKCPFCGMVQDKAGICFVCMSNLPWTDEDEYRELHGGLPCAAPLRYEGLTRDGIARLKFQGASTAAKPMGELLAQIVAERFAGMFDTVTWVPVSKKRLRERGYDQAELLAQAACAAWDTQPVRLLKKVVNNPKQSSMGDATARYANVQGIFQAVHPEEVSGKRILLIDDVCTTGASLAECARVLREAGAENVVCSVVAVPSPKRKCDTPCKNGLAIG